MKKIILSVALASAVLSSCSLQEEPIGTLTFNDAFENVSDFERFRNGLYSDLRAIGAGAYVSTSEMQMDMFNGTITNGNRLGNIANGDILSGDADIESLWAGLYGSINTSNLMIEKADEFIKNHPDISEADQLKMTRYNAEAHFNRAYMYIYMFNYFCQSYTEARADQPALGLPIVTIYHPTPDRSSYPGRSTMRETFKLIDGDLKIAYEGLKEYEDKVSASNVAPNAIYLNSYTVQALRARTALYKGEYDDALEYANDVIDCGVWSLTPATTYANIWTSDTGSELLFVPFVDASESGYVGSTGAAWISNNGQSSDYIPCSEILKEYDTKNDVRYAAFFSTWNLQVNGEDVSSPVFVKFPGNPALDNGVSKSMINKPKPFRLSEMYLIVAEAAAITGDETASLKALNELRKIRLKNNRFYTDASYSGNELINQVRIERNKELIGEGFRLMDLRRWGLGFERSYEYENDMVDQILVAIGKKTHYEPNDYRYVWPIPAKEISVNPQLVGQQNPGYN